jgi:hypothetical protein
MLAAIVSVLSFVPGVQSSHIRNLYAQEKSP